MSLGEVLESKLPRGQAPGRVKKGGGPVCLNKHAQDCMNDKLLDLASQAFQAMSTQEMLGEPWQARIFSNE